MIDLKVYIDADDDVRLSRRVLKKVTECKKEQRDFDIKTYLDKYENIVKPMYEKFIEPSKKLADIVIPNYGFSLEEADYHK